MNRDIQFFLLNVTSEEIHKFFVNFLHLYKTKHNNLIFDISDLETILK